MVFLLDRLLTHFDTYRGKPAVPVLDLAALSDQARRDLNLPPGFGTWQDRRDEVLRLTRW
jgi:hypothetical protein